MRYLVILISMLLSGAAFADVTFQCPAPDSIKQHTIPSSINCSYSANSGGIEFGGYNNCGLVGLPFVGASISQVNNYWSINCVYTNGLSNNTMSVGPNPVIEQCTFGDLTKQCKGSLADCAITCPTKPQIAGKAE